MKRWRCITSKGFDYRQRRICARYGRTGGSHQLRPIKAVDRYTNTHTHARQGSRAGMSKSIVSRMGTKRQACGFYSFSLFLFALKQLVDDYSPCLCARSRGEIGNEKQRREKKKQKSFKHTTNVTQRVTGHALSAGEGLITPSFLLDWSERFKSQPLPERGMQKESKNEQKKLPQIIASGSKRRCSICFLISFSTEVLKKMCIIFFAFQCFFLISPLCNSYNSFLVALVVGRFKWVR